MRQGDDAAIRAIAWAAVLVTHLVFAWMLVRPAQVAPDAPDDDDVLQLVWIDAPVPAPAPAPAEPPVAPEKTKPAISRTRRDAPARLPVEAAAVDAPQPSTDDTSRPLSAVFIERAGRQDADAAATTFVADPLAHRSANLPGTPGERIRMREPMSVARVARGIGALFGGGGYTTDPCPQIRANLTNLATGGESELRDEEERRLRAYCL